MPSDNLPKSSLTDPSVPKNLERLFKAAEKGGEAAVLKEIQAIRAEREAEDGFSAEELESLKAAFSKIPPLDLPPGAILQDPAPSKPKSNGGR